MIYVGYICEMKCIEVGVNCLEIGVVILLIDCYQVLVVDYLDFGELLQCFVFLQICNQGIFGGNIGNVLLIGDVLLLLIVFGVKIVLCCGEWCCELLLEEYFFDYKVIVCEEGEFIEKILVLCVWFGQVFKVYKVFKCIDDDIFVVCVVISFDLEDGWIVCVRVVFGGMVVIFKCVVVCEVVL